MVLEGRATAARWLLAVVTSPFIRIRPNLIVLIRSLNLMLLTIYTGVLVPRFQCVMPAP